MSVVRQGEQSDNEREVTIGDYQEYLRYMLPRKQRTEADLKELKKKLGVEMKVKALAVWQAKMTKETRRIV
eukprot:10283807-Ditylum_brightwellii.AAC.1